MEHLIHVHVRYDENFPSLAQYLCFFFAHGNVPRLCRNSSRLYKNVALRNGRSTAVRSRNVLSQTGERDATVAEATAITYEIAFVCEHSPREISRDLDQLTSIISHGVFKMPDIAIVWN
jgi:hypothetical protein